MIKVPIRDALKLINKDVILNITRDDFSTQTPQSFKFNEILDLHNTKLNHYKDDDMSLLRSFKAKFANVEKNNFKITDKKIFLCLKII